MKQEILDAIEDYGDVRAEYFPEDCLAVDAKEKIIALIMAEVEQAVGLARQPASE